ncbi:uncharacterized protein LOC143032702 [Oratosquilla oratoria]|uniref:uncharacterized protein LOC143032702 n=1 Tax=Oratosquilla oratoria TaxID=337810 RepID=UPI003F763B1F
MGWVGYNPCRPLGAVEGRGPLAPHPPPLPPIPAPSPSRPRTYRDASYVLTIFSRPSLTPTSPSKLLCTRARWVTKQGWCTDSLVGLLPSSFPHTLVFLSYGNIRCCQHGVNKDQSSTETKLSHKFMNDANTQRVPYSRPLNSRAVSQCGCGSVLFLRADLKFPFTCFVLRLPSLGYTPKNLPTSNQGVVSWTMGDTQLHLRWHSHGNTFTSMLAELHQGRAYTDVSLVCDGGIVRAHRAILSLCSPYLATVLEACPDTDAPLLLPDTPVLDVRFLISFIYRGQVDVPQQNISSFLATAKHLHVLGLDQGEKLMESPGKSDGCTSSSSDVSEDPSATPNINGNNNDAEQNEEEEEMEEDMEDLETEDVKIEPPDLAIKNEADSNDEVVENMEGEADVTADGRLDLNFYLQQAIQSASMPCPLCKKEFKSQSGLRDHIRLHTGERPFECEYCQMNFARASHLKRHRRMHTGEKPFECRLCGKDFSRGDKLKDHLRRHEAEDKLSKIRKQIYHPEDGVAETDLSLMPTQGGGNGTVAVGEIGVGGVVTGSGDISPAPPQVLTPKSNNTTPTLHMPPPKRRRGRPPKNPEAQLQYAQGMAGTQVLMTPTDGLVPSMLGVTSIGECILRPIN